MVENISLADLLKRKFEVDYKDRQWNIQTIPYRFCHCMADIKPSYTRDENIYRGDTITVEWDDELHFFRITMISNFNGVSGRDKIRVIDTMQNYQIDCPSDGEFFEKKLLFSRCSMESAFNKRVEAYIDLFIGMSLKLAMFRG